MRYLVIELNAFLLQTRLLLGLCYILHATRIRLTAKINAQLHFFTDVQLHFFIDMQLHFFTAVQLQSVTALLPKWIACRRAENIMVHDVLLR